jgi:hypothetical protein
MSRTGFFFFFGAKSQKFTKNIETLILWIFTSLNHAGLPNGFGLLFLHTLLRAGKWHRKARRLQEKSAINMI